MRNLSVAFVWLTLMTSALAGTIPMATWDWVERMVPNRRDAMDLPPLAGVETKTGTVDGRQDTEAAARIAVAVLHRANLATTLQEYWLVSFSAADVLAFVNTPSRIQFPPRDILLKFETAGSGAAIQQLLWLPSTRQLMFLGFRKEDGDTGQVYIYDFKTRSLQQVTHSPGSIGSYSFSSEAQILVYSASSVPRGEGRRPYRYVMEAGTDTQNNLYAMISGDPKAKTELTYFAMSMRTGRVVKIESDEPVKLRSEGPIYISPSGRWAVRRMSVGVVPESWSEYEDVRDLYPANLAPFGWRSAMEPFGDVIATIHQFQLMDLERGVTRHLLDAAADASDPVAAVRDDAVAWSADGKSVVVSGTYLPLTGQSGAERTHRAKTTVIAEVELETGRVQKITDIDKEFDRPRLEMAADGRLVVRQQRGNQTRVWHYRKTNDVWAQEESSLIDGRSPGASAMGSEPAKLRLYKVDNLQTPPELEALDLSTGRKRIITDLNSRLPTFNVGHIEPFEWTDKLGAHWKGGLLLPAGYRPQHRYPVIIQQNGFDDRYTPYALTDFTAYPGRLLASKDILVLQLGCEGQMPQEIRAKYEDNPEFGFLRSQTACFDGAIDALEAKGLIDPNRTGLVGFSAVGNYVYNAVTFSEHRFAAAVIVDSVQSSLWNYVLSYGLPEPSINEWDTYVYDRGGTTFIGSQFYGEGVKRWMERSPMLNLDRIRTPLLYEQHGSGIPCPCWDTYAILKRRQRPVELVEFPQGDHDLARPLEQFASQEGIVDWFVYWLKDQEDPDPAKAAQYERWRLLKRQQQAHMAELH